MCRDFNVVAHVLMESFLFDIRKRKTSFMQSERNFRHLMSAYIGLVSRTSFRILCDRKDSDHVTVQVFTFMWKAYADGRSGMSVRDWLLRYTCLLSRLKITARRVMYIAGKHPDLFVSSRPRVEDYDDYLTAQAWEVFCRASTAMTPVQRIVFVLVSLEGLDVRKVAAITGLFRFRVRLAYARAIVRVRQELRRFGKEGDYERFVGFMRKVSDGLEDLDALESEVFDLI